MTGKALIVAASEFMTNVRTKAFIISVVLMPVLIAGLVAVQTLLMRNVDTNERRFAVIDHTGVLYEPLAAAATARNADLASGKGPAAAPFVPSPVSLDARPIEEVRLELSDRVESKAIFAFVEIPADVLDAGRSASARMRYYTNRPTYDALPRWLETTLNREILVRRLQSASIDPAVVRSLSQPVRTDSFGLLKRDQQGRVKDAEAIDRARMIGTPAGLMMAIFLLVMVSAPQLLNSVLEEKMSRISEVLLGSVSPFDLMLGKLLASVGTTVSLAMLYLAGGFAFAPLLLIQLFTPQVFVAFVVFLCLAVLFFGALFISVGAACTEIKDAQSMMLPVMMLVMIPAFTWPVVLRSPDTLLAVFLTLFPPSAPFILLLRMSLPSGVPFWQVSLAVVLMVAGTLAVVWAAGRIFRVGILMHGKSATFPEMMRWVRLG